MKAFYSMVLVLSLPLGVDASEIADIKPPGDASPKTTQHDSVGKIPPEMEKASQMPKGSERTKALAAATLEWSKDEPTAPLAWAFQPSMRKDLTIQEMRAIGAACFKNNPRITVDWLTQKCRPIVGEGFYMEHELLHCEIMGWRALDTNSATEWCLQAPAEVRHNVYSSLGDSWARTHATEALPFQAELKSLEDRCSMASGIAVGWSCGANGEAFRGKAVDFTEITKWALGLKTPEERIAAIVGLASGYWAWPPNCDGYTTFVKTLKDKTEFRVAVMGGVRKIRGAAWGASASGSNKPENEAKVKEWMDQLQLSDSEKTDILNIHLPAMPLTVQPGKIAWPR